MDSQNDCFFTSLLNQEVTDLNDPYVANENQTDSMLQPQQSTEFESTTKKAQRSRNFSVEEDCQLVSAWLNTSIDAVSGNEQKSQKYWKRIHEYFHSNKKFTSDRTANSLMHRWSTIQLSVNKFCGFFAQIDRRQQSGVSEEDKMFQAKNMYEEIQGHTFQFLHCWHELKHHPKWMSQGMKKPTKRKNSSSDTSSPATPSSINLEERGSMNDEDLYTNRPPGRKASKGQMKKGKEPMQLTPTALFMKEFCSERKELNLKKMELLEKDDARAEEKLVLERKKYVLDEKKIFLDEKKVVIDEKKVVLDQQREEERIMAIDTTGMPLFKVQYYENLQMEIYKKRCNKDSFN